MKTVDSLVVGWYMVVKDKHMVNKSNIQDNSGKRRMIQVCIYHRMIRSARETSQYTQWEPDNSPSCSLPKKTKKTPPLRSSWLGHHPGLPWGLMWVGLVENWAGAMASSFVPGLFWPYSSPGQDQTIKCCVGELLTLCVRTINVQSLEKPLQSLIVLEMVIF